MTVMRYLPENARVDGGRILVQGEDVLRLDERGLRRWRGGRVAMVFQNPGSSLNPSMRIGTQVAEVFRYHQGLGPADAQQLAFDFFP